LGKLTKEEVILLFLEDPEKLRKEILAKNIITSKEIFEIICNLGNPELAYWYYVRSYPKEKGCQELKDLCCTDSLWAYSYARWIQRKPCDLTRQVSCEASDTARWYAIYVDKKPLESTRTAAYKNSWDKSAYCAWEYEFEINARKKA